jgi:hypothetical protein
MIVTRLLHPSSYFKFSETPDALGANGNHLGLTHCLQSIPYFSTPFRYRLSTINLKVGGLRVDINIVCIYYNIVSHSFPSLPSRVSLFDIAFKRFVKDLSCFP